MPCPSLGDLPNPGIKPRSLTLQADSLPSEPPGKPKNTGEGSLCLLQGIFLAQESNRGLLCGRWILYQLSHQRSPGKITSSGLTHRGDNSFLLSPNRVISGCLAAHKVVKYHQGSRSHHPAVLPSSEDWVSPSSSAHPFPLPRRLQWLQASPLQRIRFNRARKEAGVKQRIQINLKF